MSTSITMPALSPTMEEGVLARWLIKPGDTIRVGDVIAEIETDKATMELEAVEDGLVSELLIADGGEAVKVGAIIARLQAPGEAVPQEAPTPSAASPVAVPAIDVAPPPPPVRKTEMVAASTLALAPRSDPIAESPSERRAASPLARRVAALLAINLEPINGTGPHGRIVVADVIPTRAKPAPAAREIASTPAPAALVRPAVIPETPHEITKLSNVRKTIARRLTESKQQIPHIYLTVDIRLDALLALRSELNASLASRGVKLSVNDLMIKSLAKALILVPQCNVMFTPDALVSFSRVDISVAVSTPTGLITPIITGADFATLSDISSRMADLSGRARDNRLQPHEYQGGTASLSNLGMFGIKQFEAIINPPQAMILAVGAGERRAWIDGDDAVVAATVLSATGSFDHRAIDGADAAHLMQSFRALVEEPWLLLV